MVTETAAAAWSCWSRSTTVAVKGGSGTRGVATASVFLPHPLVEFFLCAAAGCSSALLFASLGLKVSLVSFFF